MSEQKSIRIIGMKEAVKEAFKKGREAERLKNKKQYSPCSLRYAKKQNVQLGRLSF
jgi:hypothetical protein